MSGKLIQQFATNLEAMINADTAAGADDRRRDGRRRGGRDGRPDGWPGARRARAQTLPVAAKPAAPVVKQEESLNAFKFVVVPILKRLIPVAAVGAAIAVVVRRLRRKKS